MPELIGKGKKKECLDSMCLGNLPEHGGIGAGGLRLRHTQILNPFKGPDWGLFSFCCKGRWLGHPPFED